jgi:SpoIIAA-like
MIEILADFPENIVAVAGHGVITRADYQKILVPQVEQALRKHSKIRFYYELGREFSGMEAGAMWEDFKVGFEHITRWERIAVVTDVEWIRHAINAFRILLPGSVRVFGTSETAQAHTWITATQA